VAVIKDKRDRNEKPSSLSRERSDSGKSLHYLYILESEVSGRYYIGITTDVKKRLKQHNSGKTRSTKAYIPWKLLCEIGYETRKEAAVAERMLKKSKSRGVIEKFISQQAESR